MFSLIPSMFSPSIKYFIEPKDYLCNFKMICQPLRIQNVFPNYMFSTICFQPISNKSIPFLNLLGLENDLKSPNIIIGNYK